MIKDSVGNRLNEGQFVQVNLPTGTGALRGRIKTVDEGRITRIGGMRGTQENGAIQPGLITIEITLPVEVDPRSNVALNLVRLVDPSGKDGQPDAAMQIEELAVFIMREIPGEPSENEGAVECAIRLLGKKKTN